MAKVTNHRLEFKTGSEGKTLLARWEFETQQSITTTSGISTGDWVNIKNGVTTWMNGTRIDSWVFGAGPWQVMELIGERAVLGKNQSGTNNIKSPINVNNLENVNGGSTTVSVDTLDHYDYAWFYDTGDGVWYEGENGSTEGNETRDCFVEYDPPEFYVRVHNHIIPVSKTYDVNGSETSYWTGELSIAEHYQDDDPPEVPPMPELELIEDVNQIQVTVDNITDPRSDLIEFEIYDLQTRLRTDKCSVQAAMARYVFNGEVGRQYRVRARSANERGTSSLIYSDWTDFTEIQKTRPAPVKGIISCKAKSSTSVIVTWEGEPSAEHYDLEYTDNKDYFDTSGETTTVTDLDVAYRSYTVIGLETGKEWWFRVRATNEVGKSQWCEPKSVVIGKKPAAPTTWSSTTTAIVGEELYLYWVHNAEDNSREQYAQLEMTVGNGKPTTTTIENPDREEDEDNPDDETHSYKVDTSKYTEGTKIKWRVRTSGVTLEFGDWSVMREVTIYAQPTISIKLKDGKGAAVTTLTSFPLKIEGLTAPKTQAPIGYSVAILANSSYQTVDYLGNTQIIQAGDSVFNRYIDTSSQLALTLSAGDLNLDDGISYTVSVVASMNSGLTATAEETFNVSWTDAYIPLDAQISVSKETYTAYITPYSRNSDGTLNAGYKLAVYRREFDGTFKLIAEGLDSSKLTVVTDPHPALDYARYRIVAISDSTGGVNYYDMPGYPTGGDNIVIQWDETWTNFDTRGNDVADKRVTPAYAGSMLELKYNIDVADSISNDVEHVDYVGRSYPVSYYGTKINSTSSWSTVIPATDVETVYALRRLQVYKGDCYVREPSGTGYWASIVVSFSKTHQELTIPISLDITRVDGGI